MVILKILMLYLITTKIDALILSLRIAEVHRCAVLDYIDQRLLAVQKANLESAFASDFIV